MVYLLIVAVVVYSAWQVEASYRDHYESDLPVKKGKKKPV